MKRLIKNIFTKNQREQHSGDINLRPTILLLFIIFILLPIILISKDLYYGVDILDIDLFKYVVPTVKWITEIISIILNGVLLLGWIIGQGIVVILFVIYLVLMIIKKLIK